MTNECLHAQTLRFVCVFLCKWSTRFSCSGPNPIVAVLKIGLGLETTFQGSQSRRLEGIFTLSRLGLGLDGFRIFGQDSVSTTMTR